MSMSKNPKTKVVVAMSGGVDSSVAPHNSLLSNRLRRVTTVRHKRGKLARVVCAMSGGVDSSVAVVLLKKQGFDVIGVFLKFWSPYAKATGDKPAYRENICCNQEALRSARAVAEKLKIPFYVLDASREFKKQVVDYYINEYDSGRTPNPCVVCNKFIKFGWLLKKARELGANYLATGHYARLRREILNPKLEILKKFKIPNHKFQTRLLKAKDQNKDQSYFLWQLGQDKLKHILLPIGDYKKSQVRKMAKNFGLPLAEKKESQNVCFVPDDNYSFLKKYVRKLNKPGDITDLKGHILGHHRGLAYYTLGQRHGIGNVQIRNKFKNLKFKIKNLDIRPAYVLKLDIENNNLIVGEEKDLYSKELIAENINWINPHIAKPINCRAKIRYGHPTEHCYIAVLLHCRDKIKVIFDKPQRAITPGQSVVFYNEKELLGGGVIR